MRSTATLAVSLLMAIVISDDVTRPTEETLTITNNTTASSYLTISAENTKIVAEESKTSPQSSGRDIITGLEASLVICNT